MQNVTYITSCHRIFTSIISVQCMSIRLEVNFGPKHQLLYYDYHSNVSNKQDNYFCSVSCHFSYHFSFFILFLINFFFLIFENQSAAGNVIQLIKKISLRPFQTVVSVTFTKSIYDLQASIKSFRYRNCFLQNIYGVQWP